MFITSQMALISITLELFAGGAIGLATLAILHRSHIRPKTTAAGVIIASFVFLAVCGVGGWADSHSEFVNGKRVNFASWGEDLRVRNFLADNELILAPVGSVLAALLAGVSFRRMEARKPEEIGQPHK